MSVPAEQSFRFESDMVDSMIRSITSVIEVHPGLRFRLLREVGIGSVIPDVLLGVWSGELPQPRGLNTVSRHVLARLMEDRISISQQQLCETLFLSDSAVADAINSLTRAGAINLGDSGDLELRSEYQLLESIHLVAIEVKLKRWKEALEQAATYKKFANEAYVVLDASQVRIHDGLKAAFLSRGVGLLLQTSNQIVKVIDAVSDVLNPSVNRIFATSKLMNAGPYCCA